MLGDEASKYDPAQLLMIAGQMEAMIPPEVRAYLESVTKDIATSCTEGQVFTAEKVKASIASSSSIRSSFVNINNERDLGNSSDHQERDLGNIQERDLGNTNDNSERYLENTYDQDRDSENTSHLRERALGNTHDWERDSKNIHYDQALRGVTIGEVNMTEEVGDLMHPKRQLRFCMKEEVFQHSTYTAKRKLRIRRAISLAIKKRILKSQNKVDIATYGPVTGFANSLWISEDLNSNFIIEDSSIADVYVKQGKNKAPIKTDVDYRWQGDEAEVDTCDRKPEEVSVHIPFSLHSHLTSYYSFPSLSVACCC
jgi:hypothetical protein